jgi:hypothetical protein
MSLGERDAAACVGGTPRLSGRSPDLAAPARPPPLGRGPPTEMTRQRREPGVRAPGGQSRITVYPTKILSASAISYGAGTTRHAGTGRERRSDCCRRAKGVHGRQPSGAIVQPIIHFVILFPLPTAAASPQLTELARCWCGTALPAGYRKKDRREAPWTAPSGSWWTTWGPQ